MSKWHLGASISAFVMAVLALIVTTISFYIGVVKSDLPQGVCVESEYGRETSYIVGVYQPTINNGVMTCESGDFIEVNARREQN